MRYLFEEYALDTDRRELHRGADVVRIAPQYSRLRGFISAGGPLLAFA
ncbi:MULTISPECIES: hypothetical protein [unclassified Bradyrhizobium]